MYKSGESPQLMFPPFVENWLTLTLALLLLHISMEIIDRFRFDPAEAEKTSAVATSFKSDSKDVTSKYFSSPTKRSSVPPSTKKTSKFLAKALEVGFQQSEYESNLPGTAEPEKLQTPILTAEQWADRMTDSMRHELYLGNIPELVKHANDNYPNGMSTRQVRAWLTKFPKHVPDYLEGSNFAVDHIISDSVGGVSHPFNFFLLPRVLNNRFSGWATLEKRRCVGMAAWGKALDLQRWYSLKAKGIVNLSQFDPVTDHYMVQRSR